MIPKDMAENLSGFCEAIGGVSRVLIAAGVTPEQMGAALRIEAASVEALVQRAEMPIEASEALDVQRRAHEFINTMQVAGIDERTIVAAIGNALIERTVRRFGPAGSAQWLRDLATMVLKHGADFETTAQHS